MKRDHRILGVALVLFLAPALPLAAQDRGAEPFAEEEEGSRYRFGLEVRTHYRDSEETRVQVNFPFGAASLPPGFVETVDAGESVQVSLVTVEGLARWREDLEGRVKIDIIDRYDRNPTSEDREVDVDEAWLRFGREAEPAVVPARRGWYVKLGKFGKFERQDERPLESYGLVSTSFNRLEDVGVELGADLTRHLYVKASFTQGNPLFMRDPNALAGDNGLGTPQNPVLDAKTGVPILYDADVDTIDFAHPEVGLGLGLRGSSATGFAAFDLLAWGYRRELAEEAPLGHTFYGGDLDLLDGPNLEALGFPRDAFSLPITGDEKEEVGVNLWLYLGGFALFGQWVDQEVAGLDRSGFEVEAAWTFERAGRRVFGSFTPVVRYSELDPDFRPDPGRPFPAPSLAWDWEKLDVGFSLSVIEQLALTLEWTDATFTLFNGDGVSHDELLLTLALAFDRTWPRL